MAALLNLQEEDESLSGELAATSQPSEPQQTPAQAPKKHYRNREHFATIRTASLVRTHFYAVSLCSSHFIRFLLVFI